ncbi:MAG: hypothetical protein M0P16_01370 [Syntrophales bacterium]|nr:hypothetical protein [Syntrophales bacterium]MCK9392354.1 hypothetical protein [Syntrophales bacterium]
MDRLGISVHQDAALAIACRGLGFTEKPASAGALLLPDGVHVTFKLPARNRLRHADTGDTVGCIRKSLVAAACSAQAVEEIYTSASS